MTASSIEAILAPQCAITSIGTADWINGTPPPSAPRMEITTFGSPGTSSIITRNSLGLALGDNGRQFRSLTAARARLSILPAPGAYL